MIPINKLLNYNLKDIGHQILLEKSEMEEESDNANRSDDGPFNNIPREILFQIFSYLDLFSLGKMRYMKYDFFNIHDINHLSIRSYSNQTSISVQCCQVSRLFRGVASDPLHYSEVNLRPMFYCASNDTLKYLFSKAHYLQRLGRMNNININIYSYNYFATVQLQLHKKFHIFYRYIMVWKLW